MFRFKSEEGVKADNIIIFKDSLEALKNKIPEIKYLETGINVSVAASACDLVLITHFDSSEDLEKYKVHPDHQDILSLLKKIVEEVHVVDFNTL